MGLFEGVENFVLRIALKKAAKSAIQLIVARLMALELTKYGVHLDPDGLTLALTAGLEALRNWLKQKFNLPL